MKTIRRHLTVRLAIGLGALWLVTGAALTLGVRRELMARFDRELDRLSREVSPMLSDAVASDSLGPPRRVLDLFIPGSGFYFQIWDEYDLVSARSPSLGTAELPRRNATDGAAAYWNCELPSGEKVRARAARVAIGAFGGSAEDIAEAELSAELVVAMNRDEMDGAVTLIVLAVALVGTLSALLSIGIVAAALRGGLSPLTRLAEQTARIDAGRLDERFPAQTMPGELRPVVDKLNELMDRIRSAFERERRFGANLAHELRTPLAEIKTMAECALRWPEGETAETLAEIVTVTDRMRSLVENLSAVSRSERRATDSMAERVPLRPAVDRALAAGAGRAAARRMNIQNDVPADLGVRAVPALLDLILGNLLDNAAEYSSEGGRLALDGMLEPTGRVCLRVGNTVDAFVRADIDRLFEPGWRRDASRTGGRHHGLGLALARNAAEAMSCTLTAKLADDGQFLWFCLSGLSSC